jgi:hypothetical protein
MKGAKSWSRIGEQLSDTHITLMCAAISITVFIVDSIGLPLDVTAGVAYLPAVLLALWYSRWQYTLAIAAVASVLTLLGAPLFAPAEMPWLVVANRVIALAAIWLTARRAGRGR